MKPEYQIFKKGVTKKPVTIFSNGESIESIERKKALYLAQGYTIFIAKSEQDQAIEAYQAIKNGEVDGVKIHESKEIKVGSITFKS